MSTFTNYVDKFLTFLIDHLLPFVAGFYLRGAIGGNTSKTAVLPRFSKKERCSGGALLCIGVLSGLGAHATRVMPMHLIKVDYFSDFMKLE